MFGCCSACVNTLWRPVMFLVWTNPWRHWQALQLPFLSFFGPFFWLMRQFVKSLHFLLRVEWCQHYLPFLSCDGGSSIQSKQKTYVVLDRGSWSLYCWATTIANRNLSKWLKQKCCFILCLSLFLYFIHLMLSPFLTFFLTLKHVIRGFPKMLVTCD